MREDRTEEAAFPQGDEDKAGGQTPRRRHPIAPPVEREHHRGIRRPHCACRQRGDKGAAGAATARGGRGVGLYRDG